MAIIDKKQTRWYSKSTFDSLDKTTIPIGTEIQVTGEIEEADLTADLQTKINGKLTAPTTPMEDSVVTMLADGAVETKPLNEFSEKLYKHKIVAATNTFMIYIYATLNHSDSINTIDLLEANKNSIIGSSAWVDGDELNSTYTYNVLITGIMGNGGILLVSSNGQITKNISSLTDTITEL